MFMTGFGEDYSFGNEEYVSYPYFHLVNNHNF